MAYILVEYIIKRAFKYCHDLMMQSKNSKENQVSTGCFPYAISFNSLIICLNLRKFKLSNVIEPLCNEASIKSQSVCLPRQYFSQEAT